jgi:protein O-mannosyl-transferase
MAVSKSQERSTGLNGKAVVLVVCILLAALVFAVFGQTLRYGFVNFDDEDYFTSNPHVQTGLTWSNARWAFQIGYAANWHPLTWLSLMLDAQLFGTGPAGLHLTNVILHAVNTVLLFLLLRRLMGLRSNKSIGATTPQVGLRSDTFVGATATQAGMLWPCAFVAAAFAVHPLHVESVAWVSERKDVLSGLFFMLTLWVYAQYVSCARRQVSGERRTSNIEHRTSNIEREESRITPCRVEAKRRRDHATRYYFLCLFSFALGLMSKPMLVTVPFVLLLLDYWPLNRFQPSTINSDESRAGSQRSTILHLVLEKLPFFLLSAASCGITILAQKKAIIPTEALPLFDRIGNASISYVVYLGQMLYPVGLAIFYPHLENLPLWKIVLSLIFVAGITAGAFALRRGRPYLLVGWLWYLGTVVPVIGLLQVGAQAWADRYTYLPLIGVFIMIAWGARDLFSFWQCRRQVPGVVAFIMMTVWMVCASIQTSYWRNSESLWIHTLACTSRNYVAHCDLGSVLAKQGRVAEAIEQYQATLELKPDYVDAHNNLAILLAGQGKTAEAVKHYQRALEIKPNFAEAHNNWGNALAVKGQINEAAEHYQQALQLDPNFGEAHNGLGALLLAQGRTAEAMEHFRKAAELIPDNADVQNNLGTVMADEGRTTEALKYYQKALELKPDSAKTHYNLANLFVARGQLDEAVKHYQRALELMPDFTRARYQFGLVLQSRGKFAAAVAQFEKILELDPKHIATQNNLAWLLATCPDNSLRNGQKAVELAQQAVQLSGGKSPEILDTLAAAYAEAGRFPEAIETARRASDLSAVQNNKPLTEAIQNQLKLFETHSPYHEKP